MSFLKSRHGSYSAWNKSILFQCLEQVLMPKFGSDGQSIDAFVESETCFSSPSRFQASRQMKPNCFFQFCLNESRTEIDRASSPSQDQRHNEKGAHATPSHHWSECIEESFFQITSCHCSTFVRLHVSIRGPLVFENPLRGQDPRGRFRNIHFGPRFLIFQ
jgi:hypothetical protein